MNKLNGSVIRFVEHETTISRFWTYYPSTKKRKITPNPAVFL